MVDEPYYYLSFWSEDTGRNIVALPPLEAGSWMIPNWHGAVLKHSEVLQSASGKVQYEQVISFFKSGISLLSEHI